MIVFNKERANNQSTHYINFFEIEYLSAKANESFIELR